MEKLKARLSEPSTYAGLAAVVAGVGQVAKVNEAPAIADAIVNVGAAVASGTGWPGIAMAAFGAFAMFMREKGGR